ncbi:MAG TPA: hypothetical protein VFJ98_00275 [Mycobacteriales bacterium]|nr:hypothetical protein [Mycobacteriales bacterium]
MRGRGGGVLSASVLVALGTSLLLVAVLGFGLSALGGTDRSRAPGATRAETAAVVVAGGHPRPDQQATRRASGHGAGSHSDGTPRLTPTVGSVLAPSSPSTTSGGTSRAAGSTAGASVSPTRTRQATATPKQASPTPSPTATHGRGNGQGKGHPHPKPKKP